MPGMKKLRDEFVPVYLREFLLVKLVDARFSSVPQELFFLAFHQKTATSCFMSINDWLVVWTPLENMNVNWDDYSQYLWENAKNGNQTTNQMRFSWGFEGPPFRMLDLALAAHGCCRPAACYCSGLLQPRLQHVLFRVVYQWSCRFIGDYVSVNWGLFTTSFEKIIYQLKKLHQINL